MKQALEEKVYAIVADVTGKARAAIARESLLVADLGLDSPKALLLLVELEDALGVAMSDTAAAGMHTVGDILDYLDGRTA